MNEELLSSAGTAPGQDERGESGELINNRPTLLKPWLWWFGVGGIALVHVILLIVNFQRVPLTFGYDWPGHYTYLYHLADTWSTPPAEISAQFFNPPVYYFSVAVFQRLVGLELARAGLLLNLGAALAALAILIGLCRRLWADNLVLAMWFLAIYVVNPAVYRAFGMVRPEALLLPLTAGLLLYLWHATRRPIHWWRISLVSGLTAGLAAGVRQWGVFVEIALLLWMVVTLWPAKGKKGAWRRLGQLLLVQLIAFALPALLFLLVRGGGPTAFNAPVDPAPLEFLIDPELSTLFTNPVRPALNSRLWPIFYADYWGDYWRYWTEALGRDPAPTSAATRAGLARAMWAALPATLLIILGVISPDKENSSAGGPSSRFPRTWHRFSLLLFIVTIGGFVSFAFLFAGAAKGDTVKSLYIVYLVPVVAWFAALGVERMNRRFQRGIWLSGLLLGVLLLFLLPNALYQAPEQMASRVWEMPSVGQRISATFGEAYTLVGYNLENMGDEEGLQVELIWRVDGYTGKGYKVFVHLLDEDGHLLVQSDAVPVDWQRPTKTWQIGEYITDVHDLAVSPDLIPDGARLLVGMYNRGTGLRLRTGDGRDVVELQLRG